MTKTLCVVCLVGGGLLFAADKPEETLGLRNGRFWNSLADEARPFFLIGMLEGWQFHQLRAGAFTVKEAKAFWTSTSFTIGDLGDMLTSVYSEPENLDLPIGWAMMACHAVKRGDTTRDAVFMALRKALSDEVRRKDPHPANALDPMDVILNARPK